MKFLFQVESVI